MKINIKLIGLLLSVFVIQFANAQPIRATSMQIPIGPSASISNFDQPITALMIETSNQFYFDDFLYFYKGSWHHLEQGHDADHPFRSDPIILAQEEISLLLKSQNQQDITLHTVFCPPYTSNCKLLKKNTVPCTKPNSIPPSEWRKGFANPKPGRFSTPTAHCIIHHAAGSNYNTDYYNVVRNIYLLHTQTNGWDDIGYNYLIAQDGTLFIGRDPQGVDSEDNVQGAHFCAKNSFTMGTCILGNYQDTIPTDTTWAVLKQLLVWKLMKEKLDPNDSSMHPDATGNMLPVVAGHRDGCNTDCPGQHVYVKLPQLRSDLKDAIEFCNLTGMEEITQEVGLYESNGNLNVQLDNPKNTTVHYKIINQQGRTIQSGELTDNKIEIQRLYFGLYYLILDTDQAIFTKKFLHLLNN